MAKPNVSHLQKTKKADQQPKRKAPLSEDVWIENAKVLSRDLAFVLSNSVCPQNLYNSIVDSLNELESQRTLSAEFIFGLLSSPSLRGGAA